jgi:hypothetical protein
MSPEVSVKLSGVHPASVSSTDRNGGGGSSFGRAFDLLELPHPAKSAAITIKPEYQRDSIERTRIPLHPAEAPNFELYSAPMAGAPPC